MLYALYSLDMKNNTEETTNKKPCKRCQQTRWLMTFVILTSMLVILFLNQA